MTTITPSAAQPPLPEPDPMLALALAVLQAGGDLHSLTVSGQPLEPVLAGMAARLLPHLPAREAMVALLEISEAINRAAMYETCPTRDLPGLLTCTAVLPPPDPDLPLTTWALRQAEAWRELACAVALNAASDNRLAAVTG